MQPSPFKTSLNYGAMSALACFAMFLLVYWLGKNPLGPASWLSIWIPPTFIILCIRHFRDHQRAGYITFGDAFFTGFLTACSGGMLYALMIYIFGTLVDSSILDALKESSLTELEEGESLVRSMFGDDIYEQSLEEVKNTTLSKLATSDFFYKSLGGAIVSVVAAAIMKRNPAKVI